jgi:hypothetical protein
LIPIAVHFEEVAVSGYAETEISRLKVVFREIYESLGSIEPEIQAAKDSSRAPRKPRRPAAKRPR